MINRFQKAMLASIAASLLTASAFAADTSSTGEVPSPSGGDTTSGAGAANFGGGIKAALPPSSVSEKILRSRKMALQMAKYTWLDKVAAADPSIVAAICADHSAALTLANHRRIAEIANADHYLCRRLTVWPDVAYVLVHNPNCGHVLELDPQGIYCAISQNPNIGRILASHTAFQEMVVNDPNLAKVMAAHMR